MAKYKLYAYADGSVGTRVIQLYSIGDWRNEISEKTDTDSGAITSLSGTFKAMKLPAPFNFTWKPNKDVPASHFSSLKYGAEITLELRIQVKEGDNVRSSHHFNFLQAKYLKSKRVKGGMHRVEASYNYFEVSAE
ncbi:MAG TPA: hypothetical protein VK612_11150 [Pyrinomonadaceae bacterium]|nr:hypothetical protein [Pyrinomonadaceae bacterium]